MYGCDNMIYDKVYDMKIGWRARKIDEDFIGRITFTAFFEFH
jgi:hypothetical protein